LGDGRLEDYRRGDARMSGVKRTRLFLFIAGFL